MKTALKILSIALASMFIVSCSQEAIYYDASGDAVSVSSSGKFVAAPVAAPAPVVHNENHRSVRIRGWNTSTPVMVSDKKHVKVASNWKKKEKKVSTCTTCYSSFCPKPDRCGTVSNSVLSRATMQGGSGEPQLGLIPTMKTLAPEL